MTAPPTVLDASHSFATERLELTVLREAEVEAIRAACALSQFVVRIGRHPRPGRDDDDIRQAYEVLLGLVIEKAGDLADMRARLQGADPLSEVLQAALYPPVAAARSPATGRSTAPCVAQ